MYFKVFNNKYKSKNNYDLENHFGSFNKSKSINLFSKWFNKANSTKTNLANLAGVNRLNLEFSDYKFFKKIFKTYYSDQSFLTLSKAIDSYISLVDYIVQKLKNASIKADLENGKYSLAMQEEFFIHLWGVLRGDLKINFGTNRFEFLWESLITNNYDCDTLSCLVFDVAAKMNMPIWFVVVPSHVFVRTDKLFFETTTGVFHKLKYLYAEHPFICEQISTENIKRMDAVSFITIAWAKFERGDKSGAIKVLLKAYELYPDFSHLIATMSNIYFYIPNYNLALYYYNKALEYGFENSEFYFLGAFIFYKLKNYSLALNEINKSLALNPELAKAYGLRSLIKQNFSEPDYAGALEDLNIAINLQPKNPKFFYNRGILKEKLGYLKDAQNDFLKAKELSGKV